MQEEPVSVGLLTRSDLNQHLARAFSIRFWPEYKSRNSFADEVGRMPELRNQIMHPFGP
jgi:hypothetical protein